MPNPDKKKATADNLALVEVGPRCCLNPVKIFGGSFGGPVLYANPAYVSPNVVQTFTLPRQCCHDLGLLWAVDD